MSPFCFLSVSLLSHFRLTSVSLPTHFCLPSIFRPSHFLPSHTAVPQFWAQEYQGSPFLPNPPDVFPLGVVVTGIGQPCAHQTLHLIGLPRGLGSCAAEVAVRCEVEHLSLTRRPRGFSQNTHMVTSLTRKRTPLGPYRRPMPRVLRGVLGGS